VSVTEEKDGAMNTSENRALPGMTAGDNPLPVRSRAQVKSVHIDHMADKPHKWDKVEDAVDGSAHLSDSSAVH
jgi:hypothetical protein